MENGRNEEIDNSNKLRNKCIKFHFLKAFNLTAEIFCQNKIFMKWMCIFRWVYLSHSEKFNQLCFVYFGCGREGTHRKWCCVSTVFYSLSNKCYFNRISCTHNSCSQLIAQMQYILVLLKREGKIITLKVKNSLTNLADVTLGWLFASWKKYNATNWNSCHSDYNVVYVNNMYIFWSLCSFWNRCGDWTT